MLNTLWGFEQMDEMDLAIVLEQVVRRMYALQPGVPNTPFWCQVLRRVGKVLSSNPSLTDEEKQTLATPSKDPKIIPKIQVIKGLNGRTGLGLQTCKVVVETWMKHNLPYDRNN